MRWFPNISHSSSRSSSSSTRLPSSYSESPVRDRFRRGQRVYGPRLTRQRKLRHLTPLDVPPYQESRPPASPSELSRSQGACAEAVSRSSPEAVPLPLPLPLPEGNVDRDRCRTEGAGEGVSGGPSLRRGFASGRDKSKTSENLDGESHSAADHDHGNVNRNRHDLYWVDIPCRSAPSSAYASPQLSPHAQGTGEAFSHLNAAAKENQIWSAPEMPFDLSGLLPPAFFNTSPIQSPNRQARSPGRPSLSHPVVSADPSCAPPPRLSVDVSNPRLENVNVHPLPLPPGASLPSPSSPAPHVPPNQEFVPMNSHWQKGKLIGRGTFGSVYVASNRETGALCAVKEVEIFPDDPKSAECIKQLEQEIRLLSQLQHQNIVQYYGSEILDDRFYIYLEYVHPGSINKYIREHCGAVTEPVVRNFTRHILSGLAYLHSKKTVHRDIKCANLLVDASGVVKLADFGMAKHLTERRADLSLKGSPHWMAPELMQDVVQKDNSSHLAFAVDIWSLGCTIIEMMNGKPPWSEYEGAAAMFKVMSDTPPIPESVSHDGKDFLKCCFRRNPAERPTAAKLLEHRFLKNSQQHSSLPPDVSSCSKLFNGMKLTEKAQDRRERSSSGFKLDQFRILPGTRSTKRATTSESFMHPSFSPSRLGCSNINSNSHL